jgi:hypothetical protein
VVLQSAAKALGATYGEETASPVLIQSDAPGLVLVNFAPYVPPIPGLALLEVGEYVFRIDLDLTGGADRTIQTSFAGAVDCPNIKTAGPSPVEMTFQVNTTVRGLVPSLSLQATGGVNPMTLNSFKVWQLSKRNTLDTGQTLATRVTLNGVKIPKDIYRDIGEDLREYETAGAPIK